jgi:glyoxylase-like metal-dependent hydrolase (beta-lactamase superfamily II)
MRLADDLYRIDGVTGANVYLLVAEDGLTLVDTGMPGNAKTILDAIRGIGREPSELRRIVLTHSDPDHSGSAAHLKDLTGALVAIHEHDAPALAGKRPKRTGGIGATPMRSSNIARAGHDMAMRLVFKLSGRFRDFKPVDADILLKDGDTISGLHVMHVPGHTRGSIALYREDGVVFSGDALLADGAGRVQPPTDALALNPARALASARMIAALGFTTLLPGHGPPFRRSGGQGQRPGPRSAVD